jgi:hypothetical protein
MHYLDENKHTFYSIGVVFKNWVKVRIKYLFKYEISEKKMAPIIPLAVTVHIANQP